MDNLNVFDNDKSGVQITLTKEPHSISNDVMEIVGMDWKGNSYSFLVDKNPYYHLGDIIGVLYNIVFGNYIVYEDRKVN